MISRRIGAFALACLVAAGAASGAEAPRRLLVIPFAGRGAPEGAWKELWPVLSAALRGQGFDIVEMSAVEEEMRIHRLRDPSILSHEEIAALAVALKADRVILGSLYRLDGGGEPTISFSGRVIQPDRLEIEAISATMLDGKSLRRALGMGGPVTRARVLEEASRRFTASLVAGLAGASSAEELKALLRGGSLAPAPASYLAPGIGDRRIHRITILPFRNQTKHVGAGQTAAEMFAWCLQASGQVSLVDSGDATRRLLLRGWHAGLPVGRAEVVALRDDPGVDAVLMGTVDRWEVSDQGAAIPPEISFTVRLLDAATGEILWAAEHERSGDETSTIYGIGSATLAESLLARSAFEVLEPLLKGMKTKTNDSRGDARP
ncbi:MAG: hypothetical protein HY049_15470 [Acidobacteria bacterium]|nr:hypothetical protein [Acidobacteriota bacterium]